MTPARPAPSGWQRLGRRLSLVAMTAPALVCAARRPPHNVILFVPDGLRATIVDESTAPALTALRRDGVEFRNSHSLFPTFTTANASALATGHGLGDTGDFGNAIYAGFPFHAAGESVVPFLENNLVLREMDGHFGGNYLDEESLLAAARRHGMATAAIGKLGPVGIQDLTALDDGITFFADDTLGRPGGLPISVEWRDALTTAGLDAQAPGRGDNGKSGDFRTAGTLVPNTAQQRWFTDLITKVVLPRFKSGRRPFVLVFWSREPDGTEHAQGDSFGRLVPGINGPTSLAAIRNADDSLAQIRETLRRLDLDRNTDIFVAADHGFSVIAKASPSSTAAEFSYADVVPGELPPGFVALDLAEALAHDAPGLRLFDAVDGSLVDGRGGHHPKGGSGLIGLAASAPEIVVAANGGSDLIYLPTKDAAAWAPKVVEALMARDYVSGIFVDDRFGDIAGTLPLSAIGLTGSARTPVPAIVVNFRSFGTGCGRPVLCAAEVADTGLQQGQGMHGSFSRADTWNFMAAIGPDFHRHQVDVLPASNADVGRTLLHLLGLGPVPHGASTGRVLGESLAGGRVPRSVARTRTSRPGSGGLTTIVRQQLVGSEIYSDAAGFPGRTVGLDSAGDE